MFTSEDGLHVLGEFHFRNAQKEEEDFDYHEGTDVSTDIIALSISKNDSHASCMGFSKAVSCLDSGIRHKDSLVEG